MEPKIVQIKGGWAAVAEYWSVFGQTKEEAEAKFREAEKRHLEIAARSEPEPSVTQ